VFPRQAQGESIGHPPSNDDVRLRVSRWRKREEDDSTCELSRDANGYAERGTISERCRGPTVFLRIDLEVVDDVVVPVAAAQIFGHLDDVGKLGGNRRLRDVEPYVRAVRQQHRQRHRIVRQHLLGDVRDPVNHIAQRTRVGQRRQQRIEQFKLRGLLAQRGCIPACVGQTLM